MIKKKITKKKKDIDWNSIITVGSVMTNILQAVKNRETEEKLKHNTHLFIEKIREFYRAYSLLKLKTDALQKANIKLERLLNQKDQEILALKNKAMSDHKILTAENQRLLIENDKLKKTLTDTKTENDKN